MADPNLVIEQINNPVPAPTSAEIPNSTPPAAAEAPPVATAPETPLVAPVVAPAPEATPTPAPVETAPVAAPEAPKTLLAAEPPKPVEPPVEAKPPEEPKNEGGQSDEPAPPPKYEPFQLPENIQLGETELGEFTNLLAELEVSGKADHAVVQQFGQKAVEFHVNEVRKAVDAIHQHNLETWEQTKTEWKESFLKDPEIGGNRFQTTVDAAQTFIRTHGGTPEQQAEFRQIMESSGLGNHPAMIRILATAQLAMDEGRILAAVKPPAPPKSKTATLYGNS